MNHKQLAEMQKGVNAPNSEEYLEAVDFVKQEKARLDRVLSELRSKMAKSSNFQSGDRVEVMVSVHENEAPGVYVINEVWTDNKGQVRYNFRKPKGRKLSEKIYFLHYLMMKKC